jgi:hypothetical protein
MIEFLLWVLVGGVIALAWWIGRVYDNNDRLI